MEESSSMTMPDTRAALAAALAAVQAELPEVKKTRSADVNNKEGRFLYSYSYADLSDASAAILPILGKHGLSFTTFPGHQPDGKFGLRYWLLHKDGGSIEGFFEIADQGGMQMIGGRITYARRYCLCAVTGIAAEDDVDAREDGNGNGNGRKVQRRQQPAADKGEQQPQRTAQRRAPAARNQRDASPFDALPPLPGEEEDPTTSGASSSAAAPGSASRGRTAGPSPSSPDGSAAAPDDTDYDTPGTVTDPQIKRIWTTLRADYGFGKDETDKARAVCAHIVNHDLATSKNLSFREAGTVIDTLANWSEVAGRNQMTPRQFLDDVLNEARVEEVPTDA